MNSNIRPLWLDYVRPPPGRQWPGWLLLGAALLGSGFFFALLSSTSRQLNVIEQEVSRLKNQIERRRMLVEAEDQVRVESGQEQGVRHILPLNKQWSSLLLALEQTIDDSVTLLGLEPGIRDIVIAGEARDLGAVLDFVKRLQGNSVFIEVYLTKHEIDQASPYRPVRFNLRANWREALP